MTKHYTDAGYEYEQSLSPKTHCLRAPDGELEQWNEVGTFPPAGLHCLMLTAPKARKKIFITYSRPLKS